jgi:predicted transcriptional regulator
MRDDSQDERLGADEALRMTADVVSSYAANNKVAVDQLPELIRSVHRTMLGLSRGEEDRLNDRQKPAVAANKSIHNDYIICLEDGRKLKMLKRYLRSTYNMSPEEYRKRWNLPADYPMVAPAYAARRSEFAKKIGLGKGVRRKEP